MATYTKGEYYSNNPPTERWETSPLFNELGVPITEFFHAVIGGLGYARDRRPFASTQLNSPSYLYSNTIDLKCFGFDTGDNERFRRFNLCAHGDVAKLLNINGDNLMLHPISLF